MTHLNISQKQKHVYPHACAVQHSYSATIYNGCLHSLLASQCLCVFNTQVYLTCHGVQGAWGEHQWCPEL